MFIELTDHLRCPAEHDESFLVLLPEAMEGRLVRTGLIGCPVCHREVRLEEGVADFGGGWTPQPSVTLSADAAQALLGLDGPGGFLVLIGGAATLAEEMGRRIPGLSLVLVNPPAGTTDSSVASVLRADRLPIKARSMRGAVLPKECAELPGWLDAVVGCILPGLRLVGEGSPPRRDDLEVLAEAGGWWVGQRRGERRHDSG